MLIDRNYVVRCYHGINVIDMKGRFIYAFFINSKYKNVIESFESVCKKYTFCCEMFVDIKSRKY